MERGADARRRRARSATHGHDDRTAHEPKEVLMTTKRVRSGFIATIQQLPTATLLLIIVSLLCHDIGYVRGICRGDARRGEPHGESHHRRTRRATYR